MTSSFLIAASFRFGACFRIAALALLLGAIPSFGAGAEARFTAMLEDGTRLSGPDVGPWHFAGAQPKLGGERLFDPANPLRWLRDHHLPLPATPEAFIEFYGGDRFPGEVVRFFQGDESIGPMRHGAWCASRRAGCAALCGAVEQVGGISREPCFCETAAS